MGYIKPIEELEFTDDFMFGVIMRNKEICAGVLERLLKIKIKDIEYPELQKTLKPYYQSHGIRMDVYVKDSDRIFDIEIQTTVPDAIEKRMRYYQSMVDMDALLKGKEYDELKESYILFICKHACFKAGLPVYEFETYCKGKHELLFNDNTHKIVYNASSFEYEKDADLQKLLQFVETNQAHDEFTRRLSDSVDKTKENELFRSNYFSMNLHDYDLTKKAKAEGILEGKREGILEANRQTAKLMLKDKIALETICNYTGLSLEEIKRLEKD